MRLRIDKAIYGGNGLGRVAETDAEDAALAGKTIFVQRTLPGELVDCQITEDRRSFANARLLAVIEPALERVEPGCEYFARCGGCQYQHASQVSQLAMKRHILVETLARAGVPIEPETVEILSGEPWQYRNRVRLHIRFGDFRLCYREPASHRDVMVDHCPIAAPVLQEAIKVFAETAQSCGLAAGVFEETELFTNGSEDTLLLSLWTSQGAAATRALPVLCEALQERLPVLRGALLFQAETQKGQGNRQAVWGEPSLLYPVNTHVHRVSAGSFFQVNRFLLPAMVDRVTAGKHGRIAWDLYAGAGLFSLPLATVFEQVVAVEVAPSSVRDLRVNLQGKAHRIHAATTLDFLKSHAGSGASHAPDLVVVDPPRAGLDKYVTTLLSQIGPAAITYISCDPTTLARDLQSLLHSGYRLKNSTLIDLFPQTFHIETMVELVRA